jgi:hypothetical protein
MRLTGVILCGPGRGNERLLDADFGFHTRDERKNRISSISI